MRRGKSLVEMLVLMTIMSTLLGLVSVTLVALLRTDRQIRRDIDQQVALVRLGRQFRLDAHAARDCRIGPTCDFALSDSRQIRYSFSSGQVVREVREGDELKHRDAFRLPAAAVASFELPGEENQRMARLRIVSQENADRPFLAAVRPCLIEAAIGVSAGAALEALP